MNCVFCNLDSKDKKWHLDCFDTAIEEMFGKDVYNFLLQQSLAINNFSIPHWMERLIQEGVNEGRRNITRFKIYATLFALRNDEKTIREKILEFNKHCRPPENDREVEYHCRQLERRFFSQ